MNVGRFPAADARPASRQKRRGLCQSVESELYGSQPISGWAQKWAAFHGARDPGTRLAARVSPEHEKETMKGN